MAEENNAGEDPRVKLAKLLADKLISQVKVERFDEPKTVQATAAVSFRGDTVYCLDDGAAKFAETAAKALAMHVSCALIGVLSTPEGLAKLLGD